MTVLADLQSAASAFGGCRSIAPVRFAVLTGG